MKPRRVSVFQGLVSSENKRNRVRGNARNNKQVRNQTHLKVFHLLCHMCGHMSLCLHSSSVVKEKRDAALQNIRELITKSPSILGSKGQCDFKFI